MDFPGFSSHFSPTEVLQTPTAASACRNSSPAYSGSRWRRSSCRRLCWRSMMPAATSTSTAIEIPTTSVSQRVASGRRNSPGYPCSKAVCSIVSYAFFLSIGRFRSIRVQHIVLRQILQSEKITANFSGFSPHPRVRFCAISGGFFLHDSQTRVIISTITMELG